MDLVRTYCFSKKTQTKHHIVESKTLAVRRTKVPSLKMFCQYDSILKISVHTDGIDSGATLSELDFRPSSKY